MVRFFDPDLGMFAPVIHDHVDQHSAAWPGARAGTVHFGGVDPSPFSSWAPVSIELVEGIVCMFAGILGPVGIIHPYPIGGLEILLLQRIKEFSDNVLLGPVSEKPT